MTPYRPKSVRRLSQVFGMCFVILVSSKYILFSMVKKSIDKISTAFHYENINILFVFDMPMKTHFRQRTLLCINFLFILSSSFSAPSISLADDIGHL